MIKYFKMKKMEFELKYTLYSLASFLINEQENIKDIFELMKKLYIELKDIPTNDLQKEFISKIAELSYERVNKERKAEADT